MKKKFSLKKVMILSLILLFSYIYAQYNIKHYSIYYARNNTELRKLDSDMLMILKNWWILEIPTREGYEKNKIIDQFFYSYQNKDKKTYETISPYADNMNRDDSYSYTIFKNGGYEKYVFNYDKKIMWFRNTTVHTNLKGKKKSTIE